MEKIGLRPAVRFNACNFGEFRSQQNNLSQFTENSKNEIEISVLKKYSKWEPKNDLNQGLLRTINWIKNDYLTNDQSDYLTYQYISKF